MSLSTQESDEDNSYVLVARLDNARTMANILKAVHFSESAIVFASRNGLKVTVEESKCIQANAFLQVGLFQHFIVREEQVIFRDCLNIFGVNPSGGSVTALKLCYGGYGSPLSLFLEENGVLTDCSIVTQDAHEILDFNFTSTNVINKIIMKSECLKDAFSELDLTSEVLQIVMSPDKPYFRLSTFGNAGSNHSDFPKESDMMESFQCEKTQTNRYKLSLLKPSVKALMLSTRISIRMDKRGFLSMQYMIKTEDGQVCFVEYFCAPDETDDIDDCS